VAKKASRSSWPASPSDRPRPTRKRRKHTPLSTACTAGPVDRPGVKSAGPGAHGQLALVAPGDEEADLADDVRLSDRRLPLWHPGAEGGEVLVARRQHAHLEEQLAQELLALAARKLVDALVGERHLPARDRRNRSTTSGLRSQLSPAIGCSIATRRRWSGSSAAGTLPPSPSTRRRRIESEQERQVREYQVWSSMPQ
jgi:hypothetical protein